MTKTLILTMRNLATLVGYSHLYEFEDVIQEVLSADILSLEHYEHAEFCRKLGKITNAFIRFNSVENRLTNFFASSKSGKTIDEDYDFILANFNTPYEATMLYTLGNWRKKCQKAACYIVEFWEHDLPKCEYFLDLLKDFDHIFLGYRQCIEQVSKITGKPCSYLPLSVDTLRFCPLNILDNRPIDICNLGRRSSITHQSLSELAKRESLFYYFDTLSTSQVKNAKNQQTFSVKDPREHRSLLSNILKRSSYFIANRARANESTRGSLKDELSSRFFEGAAAGTVMIGEPPDTEDFHTNFDWQDAVIKVPFDYPDIDTLISELNQQSDRLNKIRIQNALNSLRRHDSVYRLKEILKCLDIEASSGIKEREKRLEGMLRIHGLEKAKENDREIETLLKLAS